MFSDSTIAKAFKLSKTKCMYYICYGIAPVSKAMLLHDIRLSPFFCVLFDESMNRILQEEQMDVQIRYWNDSDAAVKTRYLASRFLRRPNADNLVSSVKVAVSFLPLEKMNHLSMDGPSTNWVVFDLLSSDRSEYELPVLSNLGSCGMHVVHGAFQTGIKASDWSLEKVMKAMWRLFHDSPARRDVYIRLNSSELFPLRFYPTRRVEDEDVASRAIVTWPFVVNVIRHFQSLCPSKRSQKNGSFDTLVLHHTDSLMLIKFQFFQDIANLLNVYLKQFQTDNPMIPFISDTLEKVMRQLMKMFLRRKVVDEAVTP